MKISTRIIVLAVLALLAGFITVKATGLLRNSKPTDRQFSQTVNLALRQTADRLLDLAGDTTRRIPPVEQVSAKEFLLRLENNFNYDSLPDILQNALRLYGLHDTYYVTVVDCLNNDLILGYAKEDLIKGTPPCGGRERKAGCYNLSVVFPGRASEVEPESGLIVSSLAIFAFALASIFAYKRLKNKALTTGEEAASNLPDAPLVRFGNTAFDPANLYVLIGGDRQSLTFREGKLLHFFVQNTNQLLERDAILAAVWEDEGVIVGRSLDVFVSRLRKILQNDPTVKIANVHGVGYRFEVA